MVRGGGEKIRVLFVSHDSGLYGAQRSLLEILSNLDRGLFEPYLAAPYRGGLTAEAAKLSIPVIVCQLCHWIPSKDRIKGSQRAYFVKNLWTLAARVKEMARIVDEERIDVIYTNTVTCIEGALAARVKGRPHIWHLREAVQDNEEIVSSLPPWLVSRVVASLSDHVLFTSHSLSRRYVSNCLRAKASVIYNGIEMDRFCSLEGSRWGLASELNVNPKTKMVALVGAIHPRKDHLTFVEAAAKVRSRVEQVAFLIVGEGDRAYKAQVEAKISKLGLRECFHFLGWRADIPTILTAIDVLVVASKQEPFGRTIIEAMAAGTPVVATRSGGPEEIVLHGETGYLVPVGAPEAMGAAVGTLLLNSSMARSLGAAGRERAKVSFGRDQYVTSVQKIINQVVDSSHRNQKCTM